LRFSGARTRRNVSFRVSGLSALDISVSFASADTHSQQARTVLLKEVSTVNTV
jgi:hypothetical protein